MNRKDKWRVAVTLANGAIYNFGKHASFRSAHAEALTALLCVPDAIKATVCNRAGEQIAEFSKLEAGDAPHISATVH